MRVRGNYIGIPELYIQWDYIASTHRKMRYLINNFRDEEGSVLKKIVYQKN